MKDKVAIITGGSRGLGKSAVLHLAQQGVGVILTYQSQSPYAQDVVNQLNEKGFKATALKLDLTQSHTFPQFAEEVKTVLGKLWGRSHFDFLVNNAGIGIHVPFTQTSEDQFDLLMNIHLKGTFFLTQNLLPIMKDGGRILNISSGLARFVEPGYAAYAAMKGAVEVLTRYLALELGPRGITVNTLAPGAIETDFGGGLVRDN